MIKSRLPIGFLLIIFSIVSAKVHAQRFLTDIDSSFFIKDTVRPVIKRFENLVFSGYMQPQFQVAESDGAPSYAGGAFSPYSKSRFMLRRARVKTDYLIKTKKNLPLALFTFQIDATERGVIVRDMFIRLFETKGNNISVTTGLFARPFGYEVNYGSSYRESPERGRMSQILMPGERDLGVAMTFESLDGKHKLKNFKLDAGFFNGQGVVGVTDFDSYKDFISRLILKPQKINKNSELGAGLSMLRGGLRNGSKYVFEMGTRANGSKAFLLDSSESNLGASAPRHYYGGDVQYKINNAWGATEFRAEYWFGTQPGTSTSTTNPGLLPISASGIPLPTYVRHFNGAFFYYLQNIINAKHQLIFKYDWYDPNIKVSGLEIGEPGANLNAADIKFSTFGMGYTYYFSNHIKLVFYYDFVKNETTQLTGFTEDLKDNIFTLRLQFKF